jgi:hypothetical protein
VTAIEGKCALPRELVEKYVGTDHKAAIISLESRMEIWSAPRFEKHTEQPEVIQPTTAPACNGLPPERK